MKNFFIVYLIGVFIAYFLNIKSKRMNEAVRHVSNQSMFTYETLLVMLSLFKLVIV